MKTENVYLKEIIGEYKKEISNFKLEKKQTKKMKKEIL